MAYLLALVLDHKLKGVWEGLIIGSVTHITLYFLMLRFRVNWPDKALEISNKMKKNSSDKEDEKRGVNDVG